MNVIIITEEGFLPVEVGLMETVLEVKQKLEILLGIPVPRQTLSIYDLELIDGFEMEFYSINESTQINLTIKANERFQILVKIMAREITFQVEGTDTVVSLKDKIHNNIGTPIKQIILFSSGTEMDDHWHLSDYGIGMHSEIIAIIKPITHSRMVPQPKRLSLIVHTSTVLNSMSIPIEMNEYNTVDDVRKSLLDKNYIPQDDYFFIHKQRIMKDSQSLRWHGVRNGDTLHVFEGTVSRGD